MPKLERHIKDRVILIGYDLDGICVYSDLMSHEDYYDGDHVWDVPDAVTSLGMAKLIGFIFSPDGILDQEFVRNFNRSSGVRESGEVRFADGTVQVR